MPGRVPGRAGRVDLVVDVNGPRRTTGLVATLESLIDPETRGDPMSPLRWTSKSIRVLTRALRERGHQVSDGDASIAAERGYSLQANAKTTEGTSMSIATPSSPTSTSRRPCTWRPGTR